MNTVQLHRKSLSLKELYRNQWEEKLKSQVFFN